ncbi:MAG TPA: Holliday junction branch migration DNA helicase RuvB [Vampirovibrionales bacterium]
MSPIQPTNFSSNKKAEFKGSKNISDESPSANKASTKAKKTLEHISEPQEQKEDTVYENNLRPNSLEEYVGQDRLKQILRIGIEAAIKRKEKTSIGHILLYGPPGLGKTSCAFLLAKLIGSQAHIFSAPSLDKPKDIVGVLMSLKEGDVVFIDEIHRLNKITEELLYPALEDFVLDLPTGKGVSARVTRLPLPKFVLVGATTKLGSISAPLRDRFTQVHKMEFYSKEELSLIASRTAKLLDFGLEKDAALIIGKRARGTPRIANRLCRLVRDFIHHKNKEIATVELTEEALELFQIDEYGLDHTDRELLKAIVVNHDGGPVGVETLAITLGEDSRTIEDHYEPYLIQSGLLERTSKGRKVTPKTYDLFGDIFDVDKPAKQESLF